MLLRRCPSRSLTIVGDRAQARHGFPESWQERLQRVGVDPVDLASLTLNYRTPEEVMAEAEPVIRSVLPDANVPTSVRSSGVPVEHGSVSDIGSILDSWLAGHADGIAAVIAVGEVGNGGFRATSRVRSLTPELAKGLEFDLVVLVDPDTFGTGIEGAVDRYVAMTRATQRLVVLTSGERHRSSAGPPAGGGSPDGVAAAAGRRTGSRAAAVGVRRRTAVGVRRGPPYGPGGGPPGRPRSPWARGRTCCPRGCPGRTRRSGRSSRCRSRTRAAATSRSAPMSCRRREPTARDGSRIARLTRLAIRPEPVEFVVPRTASMMLATNPSRNVNRAHHQNSERRARPLKSTYLLKQILTASGNDTGPPELADVAGGASPRKGRPGATVSRAALRTGDLGPASRPPGATRCGPPATSSAPRR